MAAARTSARRGLGRPGRLGGRGVLSQEGATVALAAVEELRREGHAADADDESRYLRPLAEQVAELERKAIAAALKAHGGNKLATARQLGISRATLYGRLENPE